MSKSISRGSSCPWSLQVTLEQYYNHKKLYHCALSVFVAKKISCIKIENELKKINEFFLMNILFNKINELN